MKKTKYVCGFMFSRDYQNVVLIRKNHPVWQAGLFNGVGGHIEPGESVITAMVREFKEEADMQTDPGGWIVVYVIEGKGYHVTFLATVGDVEMINSITDEPVRVANTRDIHPFNTKVVPNVRYVIPMALDCLRQAIANPNFAAANS